MPEIISRENTAVSITSCCPVLSPQIVPATLEYLFPLHLLFWLVCVLFWILYYFARFTDPGYIPTNKARYDEALKLVSS